MNQLCNVFTHKYHGKEIKNYGETLKFRPKLATKWNSFAANEHIKLIFVM